jgi:hypothetical protein
VADCIVTDESIPVLNGFYEISREGVVVRREGGKGARKGKALKHFIASTGYPVVNICINGRPGVAYVHALMAEAFIGPRPSGKQINHIDGVKTNFAPSNLEYITQAENAAHAGRSGLIQSGENHWIRRRAS